MPICRNIKYRTWDKSMHDIGVTLSSTDMEHTLNFYKLVKYGTSIDERKKFIYAFIKYYDTLKDDLFNEHKTIFTDRMKNIQRLDI
ncbi:Plasmodium exported protein (PHISTa), unknown, putative [Plasmodium sp.]|nr:Plasmodium exported protein (PHISTa), unknown, putative [Plasmodium sp.]